MALITHSATLASGPAAAVIRCAPQVWGTSTDARPPSGQSKTSLASPSTSRAPRQWPNSCSSTATNSINTTTDASTQTRGSASLANAARKTSAAAITGKKMWMRTETPNRRPSEKDQENGSRIATTRQAVERVETPLQKYYHSLLAQAITYRIHAPLSSGERGWG